MARTQLLGTSKLRCQTPITVCREVVNTGSMPYIPTPPSALRAAQTPTHKLFYPWAEHLWWCLGWRLQGSIPMPGGLSPMEITQGSPGAPSPLVPTSSHSPVVQRLPAHPLDQKIICRPADTMVLVLPEQEHREGAKAVASSVLLLAGRRQHERGGSEGSPVGRQEFSETLFHSH